MPISKTDRRNLEVFQAHTTRVADMMQTVLNTSTFAIMSKTSQKDIYEVIANSLKDLQTSMGPIKAKVDEMIRELS